MSKSPIFHNSIYFHMTYYHLYFSIDASLSMADCWEMILKNIKKVHSNIIKNCSQNATISVSIDFFQEEIISYLWQSSELSFADLNLKPAGKSAVYKALWKTLDVLDKSKNTICVFVTDGHPNGPNEISPEDLNERIKHLKISENSDLFFLGEYIAIDLHDFIIPIKGMYRYDVKKEDINSGFAELQERIQNLILNSGQINF